MYVLNFRMHKSPKKNENFSIIFLVVAGKKLLERIARRQGNLNLTRKKSAINYCCRCSLSHKSLTFFCFHTFRRFCSFVFFTFAIHSISGFAFKTDMSRKILSRSSLKLFNEFVLRCVVHIDANILLEVFFCTWTTINF